MLTATAPIKKKVTLEDGSAETSLYGVWLYADLFDRAKYQPIYFSISQGVTTAILVYWIDTLVFFSVL